MRFVFTRRDTAIDRPDGINVSIFAYASRLVELGHEVFVVGPYCGSLSTLKSQHTYDSWPEVVPLTRRSVGSHADSVHIWALRGRSLMRSLDSDVVIVNGMLPFRLAGSKQVLVIHDWEHEGRGARSFRTALRRLAATNSDVVAATCSELIPLVRAQAGGKPIALMPNALPIPRTLISRTSRRQLVLHIGTHAYKNPLATLRAWAASDIDSELVFVGPTTPELTAGIGVMPNRSRANVQVLGYVDAPTLAGLFSSARVTSVPSVYDVPVHSPSVLESFAHGTPVVGSSISADLLTPANGVAVRPGSAGHADALRRLLSDDAEWEALSDAARQTALAFDRVPVVDQFLRLVGCE